MMSNSSLLSLFGQQLLSSGPVLLICLVACTLICLEWRRGGKASLWALLGFGLYGLLAVAGPVAWFFLSLPATSNGEPLALSPVWRVTLGLGLGLLHALALGFLLLAVLAGRAPRAAGT